ncbi:MAG: hypothetical protein PUB67_06020 [Clostridiales bacterium]|nr:hypothetical protein [Clostridiales bacterium]
MEKILAILAGDPAYVHSLADYICSSHLLKYRVIPFVDLYDYMLFSEDRHIDVLLVDEFIWCETGKSNPDKTFILTRFETEKDDELFMYQSMDQIVKRLNLKLSNIDFVPEKSYKFKIICVIDYAGIDCSSLFARALSAAYAKNDDVLFINFDWYNRELYEENYCLSALIYNLKIHADLWPAFTGKALKSNKYYDYYTNVAGYEDILSVTGDDLFNLFAGITKEKKYNTVVINCSMNFPAQKILFEKACKIFLVNSESEEYDKSIIDQLKKISGEETVKKIIETGPVYDAAVKKIKNDENIFDSKLFHRASDCINSVTKSIAAASNNKELPAALPDKEKGIVRKIIGRKNIGV